MSKQMKDIYQQQWEDETKQFFDCLTSGDYQICDDSILVPYDKEAMESNDPRFIRYDFEDTRLRDDHFCVQHSPQLSDSQLRRILSELQDNGIDVFGWNVYWMVNSFD